MAINLKSSVGTPTANSYVSLASANSYYEAHYNAQSWANLSSATNATAANEPKKKILIQATREIDRTFRFYKGKYNTGLQGETTYQALQFPRSDDYLASGTLFIEEAVKYATYEQALWIMQRTMPRQQVGETIVDRSIIGKEAYNYLRAYVTRQVIPKGKYPWQ